MSYSWDEYCDEYKENDAIYDGAGMELKTMNEKMTDKEKAIAKENVWLTRLALVLADKPQTLGWDVYNCAAFHDIIIWSKISNCKKMSVSKFVKNRK